MCWFVLFYLFGIRDFGIFLVFFAFVWYLFGVLSCIWVQILLIELKVIRFFDIHRFWVVNLVKKTTSFLGPKWAKTGKFLTLYILLPYTRTSFGRFKCRLGCDSIYYGLRENRFTILSSSSSSDRPIHNTNFLEKWLFSIIYCGKNIQSIFMKFS